MTRVNTIALGALACGLLAGCGGTTARAPRAPAGASSPRTLAYLARANRICAAQASRLERLPRPRTVEQTIAYLPTALAVMRAELTRLQAIDPPPGAGTRLNAAVQSMRELAALLARFLHELRYGTVALGELTTVQRQSTRLHAALDSRFRRAGLGRCAV
ncbi:MAG TPA: hypothetical protein VMF09_11490 [Solirubrobacteraceae bacterium]|nr:hypothetical protein [Solirubrobacteraceae bacterium]